MVQLNTVFFSSLIFCVLFSSFIQAADISVKINKNFVDEVEPGQQHIAELVLNPEVVNIVTHNIDPETTTISATKYDLLKNRRDVSLQIGDRILVPNAVMEIASISNLNFQELTNESASGVVVVRNIDYPEITFLSKSQNAFDLVFSKNEFILNKEEIINVTAEISKNLLPDDYEISFLLITETNENEISGEITLLPEINWSVKNNNNQPYINIGKIGKFGDLELFNSGNTYVAITPEFSDELSFLNIMNEIIIFPEKPQKIPIMFDTTNIKTPGTYNGTITISDSEESVKLKIGVILRDTICPSLTLTDVAEDCSIFSDVLINASVIDNNDILYAYFDVKEPSGNTFFKNYTDVGSEFQIKYTPKSIGRYDYQVCAVDISDNKNCTKGFFIAGERDDIIIQSNLNFGKTKLNEFKIIDLMNININRNDENFGDYTVGIKLSTLDYSENGNFILKIIEGNGNEKIIEDVGGVVNIENFGDIQIGFRGTQISNFVGTLQIIPPEYHNIVPKITFSGEVINYTIPNDFTEDWYGGQLDCEFLDTGIVDTSKIVCKTEYPITTDIKELAIPTTLEDRQASEQKWVNQIENLEEKNKFRTVFLVLTYVGVIIFLLFHVFIAYVQPIIYLKMR